MLAATSVVARCGILLVTLALAGPLMGQQAASPPEPLILLTGSLPKAGLNETYRVVLQAQGGLLPLKWRITGGSLPEGLMVERDGVLDGTPSQTGEFHFTLTASDSSQPPQQESADLVLRVVVPLFVKWSRPPVVSGHRIEGAIQVSNETDSDFDLTVAVMAIDAIGRATALGYQRFTLRKDTEAFEIPFGENLPPGSYQVNVDVVAEVPETYTIHRARLAVNEPLQIVGQP